MQELPSSERTRPKKLVGIGIVNVGSLTESREIADFMERSNIRILCLQETRWKGAEAKEIGEGVSLFYNGKDTRHGVTIAMSCLSKICFSRQHDQQSNHG
ncbi:unnamed protein product [Haemonchus placei]|uniref:Endo/exonuclease/phosphatase domain-containing protein n=1 Tax=Haemonchus placei TaxID=6290 RepID=A0A0N4W188_HAEPC|nr:unnamed protein product [Haemonchus placei]